MKLRQYTNTLLGNGQSTAAQSVALSQNLFSIFRNALVYSVVHNKR
jgi:hypothetical protein